MGDQKSTEGEVEDQGSNAKANETPFIDNDIQGKHRDVLTLHMNDSWFGKPVEEVDPLIIDETFCVISKKNDRHFIYRFSAKKSLFLLGPLNPIRKFAIYITTHRWFDHLIIWTILFNCVTLAMITNIYDEKPPNDRILPEYDYYVDRIEYLFLAIYTLELVLKVISKGLFLHKFSYLRNKWNFLDLLVVISSYVTIVVDVLDTSNTDKKDNELEFLRTFRILRAVKTLSHLPGLRMMINALLSSVIHLLEVMALTVVCIMIFSLFALEVFQGKLKQKCVVNKGGMADPDKILNTPIDQEPPDQIDRIWTEWVSDWRNWKRRSFPKSEPMQCGNSSLTRQCGSGYTCIGGLGDNPDDGWTTFDTFFNSMLSTFQLLTLDFWERLYDVVISTCGVWSLLFFLLVIFLGAYYLLNLMLAVVAMSYENEVQLQEEGGTQTYSEKLGLARANSNFSFDELSKLHICKLTYYRKRTQLERALLARKLRLSGAMDEDDQRGGENMNFGDTIFSILGMRMALSNADDDLKRNLGSISVGPQDDTDALNKDPSGHPIIDPPIAEDEDFGGPELTKSDVEINASKNAKAAQSAMKAWKVKLSLSLKMALKPIVNYWLFESTITICIILNTIILAMEHHGASKELEYILKMGNHIFMAIFTAECILKTMALQKAYFQSGWNIFDFVIVIISYLDLAVTTGEQRGSRGLSVIRSMRLLRVFKLAQSWITMKVLLNIIFSSFGALGNLTCVLFIIIYIFAVMGMQIVGGEYTPEAFDAVSNPAEFPRWNWKHFWYAFMMVFRVLCGEWIEPLWECLRAQENSIPANTNEILPYLKCFAIFLPILIVGNFIVLNLFLALLLNSFDTEELNAQREKELEAKGKAENLKTIVGLLLKKDQIEGEGEDGGELGNDDSRRPSEALTEGSGQDEIYEAPAQAAKPSFRARALSRRSTHSTFVGGSPSRSRQSMAPSKPDSPLRAKFKVMIRKVMLKGRKEAAERAVSRSEHKRRRHIRSDRLFLKNPNQKDKPDGLEDDDATPESSVKSEALTAPGDCFPATIWKFLTCSRRARCHLKRWDIFRGWCLAIVGHTAFEWTILFLIFASSFTLCFEDINLDSKPNLKRYLCYLNYAFTGLFFVEMVLKLLAIGIWGYFTNLWTLLDAFIVTVSLVSLYFDISYDTCSTSSVARTGAAANLGALKALRTLRALRPLRAISRWQGMKIVVNALMYAIPSIFNVLLVCLLFWLVFSIMGVQFFKGQFYRCVDDEGNRVDARIVPNKEVCCSKTETHGYSWVNTISNYDNVFEGYLSLLQIATFEGWMELMEYSVDAVGVDKQPTIDNQIEFYAFYVVFIIFGSFFTLRLFIGVIIDNFNMLKKKYEGNMLEILLTPSQRNYYIAMKNLGKRRPKKVIKRPEHRVLAYFYDIAMSRRLEIAIFIMIFMNMVVEAFEHYNQGDLVTHIMDGANAFFTTVYVLEAVIKIIGLRFYYFTVPWNVFDFVLVLASLMDVFLEGDLTVTLPIPPTMLRIVRVFRIGKVLRLVSAAKGIRKLLFALVVSLPALFNIGALLTLVTFIYAILGMALFGKAPRKWSIDDVFNFETFLNSNLMLLRLMSAAGWNEVLESLTVIEPVCGSFRHIECGLPNEPECPNRSLVVAYIVSFLVLTYLVVINLYIAIILENYVEASNEEDVGIVEDDIEMFYVRWSRYDPLATQFIDFADLSFFLETLDPPLDMPRPNTVAIVAFNLPIARGNKIHCLDVLHALVRHVLETVDETPEFKKLQLQMEKKFQRQFPTRRLLDIVSSTRQWKRESNAAATIQRAWRAYMKRKHPPVQKDHSTQTHGTTNTSGHGGLGHMMNRMGKFSTDNDTAEKTRKRQILGEFTDTKSQTFSKRIK